MKKLVLLLLFASLSVLAEPRVLPPVIDNSTNPAGMPVTPSSPSNNAMYEVLGRLEQLQSEVQQLRGVVEEQSQTIVDLRKRQGNIYSDLDLRLQELSGVDVSERKRQIEANNQNVGVADNLSMDGSQNSQNVGKNTLSSSVVDNAPAILDKQKNQYQSAYETLRNGHNTQAIAAFKSLLVEFPKGEYADNAQYWIGEAYKVNQDIESAKVAFTKVVSQYAGSPKVPDALLKLGYIELEQNNMAKARDYLTQVTVGHPGTTAAHLASKKLMLLGIE